MVDALVAFISFVSLIIAGLASYLMATIENRLTQKFDERYASHREIAQLVKERDQWRLELHRRIDELMDSQKEHRHADTVVREELLSEIRSARGETQSLISGLRDEIGRMNQRK